MKSLRAAATLLLLLSPVVLLAQRSTPVRLGTILPANSVWDKALKQMGAEWQKVTEGRVRLRVISGGSQGDESIIIRRMRLSNPHAAALTQPGLAEIDDAFNVFGIPFFFESDEEAAHVLEKLTPTFERALADAGLVLLNWGHGGWAHIFTAERIENLDDLRASRIFTSSGDDQMTQWYKENGFKPVPLAITDVMMGLNTGLINAYPSPPYAALLLQWYRQISYMLDIPLGPVIGATVMIERTWRRIGSDDQAAILDVARATERQLWSDVPSQGREAVAEMTKRGLTVTALDPAAEREFRATADELTASMRGGMVPNDIYDLALRERDSFRAARVALTVTPPTIEDAGDAIEVR